jgi:hypothetical protein
MKTIDHANIKQKGMRNLPKMEASLAATRFTEKWLRFSGEKIFTVKDTQCA